MANNSFTWLSRQTARSHRTDLLVIPIRAIAEHVVRVELAHRLGDFALEPEQVEESLHFQCIGFPIRKRCPAEPIGQQNREIIVWRPIAYSFRGWPSLVEEIGAELSLSAFGTAAAVRTASKYRSNTN